MSLSTSSNSQRAVLGLRAVAVVAAVAVALIVAITALAITDHTVPSSLDNGLIAILGALAGGGVVQTLNGRRQ